MDKFDGYQEEKISDNLVNKIVRIVVKKVKGYIGQIKEGEPGKPGDKGDEGDNGLAPEHQWKGTRLRFQNPDGSWNPFVDLEGEKGENGKTPVKGEDYFDGEDGTDGQTPKKGIDYSDGKDGENGKTPKKGKDYFDGKDGDDGKDGIGYLPKHEWDGTKIRFQNPDKTWGKWMDLKGQKAKDGIDGTTPKKGVDYSDGKNGKDAELPKSVTISVLADIDIKTGQKTFKHIKTFIE